MTFDCSVENFRNLNNFHQLQIVSQISPTFLCSKCKRVMKTAVQLSCGCRLCHECANTIIQMATKCPFCSRFIASIIYPDNAINRQIGHMLTECLNCRTAMKLKNMRQHLTQCQRNNTFAPLVQESGTTVVTRISAIEAIPLNCASSEPKIPKETHSWKIYNFPQISETRCCSDPFYTKDGYRMKLIIYPRGKGIFNGSDVSLGYVLMKGDNDEMLRWPFDMGIIFAIGEGGIGHKKPIPSNPTSTCNKRPNGENNENCILNFIQIADLTEYVINRCLLFKCKLVSST